MDTLAWLRCLYWCCYIFSNPTINWNSTTGKNCIWHILFCGHCMFGFFICISYALLSFGNGWKIIFKVCKSHLHFHFHTNNTSINGFFVFSLLFRLDYCGIALLIMGSFVPWLYYGFYCHYEHKLIYLSVVIVLGIVSIIVSLWDKFSEPNLRPLRAGKCEF